MLTEIDQKHKEQLILSYLSEQQRTNQHYWRRNCKQPWRKNWWMNEEHLLINWKGQIKNINLSISYMEQQAGHARIFFPVRIDSEIPDLIGMRPLAWGLSCLHLHYLMNASHGMCVLAIAASERAHWLQLQCIYTGQGSSSSSAGIVREMFLLSRLDSTAWAHLLAPFRFRSVADLISGSLLCIYA